MDILTILFYLVTSVIIISSMSLVIVNNTVHAALLLVLIFFNSAILWLTLKAEFLAIVLVLVYVGAVLVLFLFCNYIFSHIYSLKVDIFHILYYCLYFVEINDCKHILDYKNIHIHHIFFGKIMMVYILVLC